MLSTALTLDAFRGPISQADKEAATPIRAGTKLRAHKGAGRGVELDYLFNGSALIAVDAKGRLSVPAFVRSVVERRSDARSIILGVQDGSPCLNCYDQSYQRVLYAENERKRLAADAADPAAANARNRRTFGLTEEAVYDTSGRMIVPGMMRRKGQIEDLALFVGTGGTFEIWNPRLALESGDGDLADLAAWRLEEKGITL